MPAMNRNVTLMALGMFVTTTMVEAESRAYTNDNGTVIEAELVSHAKGKVKLKRADGKEFEVSPALFSDEDEAFIRKWMAENPADIAYSFRVTADKKKADGVTTNHGYKRVKNELWHFDVTIINATQESLSNFTIKYRVFYTNTADGEFRTVQADQPALLMVEGKIEEKGELGYNRTLQFQTTPVKIDSVDYDYGGARYKDTIKGCIIRIEDQTGKVVLEWVSPDVSMKSKTWASTQTAEPKDGEARKATIR